MKDVFRTSVPVIGVLHLLPLPGAPRYSGASVSEIARQAVAESVDLAEGGVDGIIIENFRDNPFLKRVGPETIAAMTRVSVEISKAVSLPLGLCVLQSDGLGAIAIAKAVGAAFIRVPYFSETYVVDAGLMDSIAGSLQRFRVSLGCTAKVFADVHIKHGYPLAQRDIGASARDAIERCSADAVIVTGLRTGGETDLEDVKRVRKALPDANLIVGSGVSLENVGRYLEYVSGIILSTSLKREGRTENVVDPGRVSDFMKEIEKYRSRAISESGDEVKEERS
jgi:membrane complex biogenesis BtpA family protein